MQLDAASRAGAGISKLQAWARGHWLAALVAIGASILMTWPLAQSAGHRVLRPTYAPERFVFRLVFARPIFADRLRLSVERPVPVGTTSRFTSFAGTRRPPLQNAAGSEPGGRSGWGRDSRRTKLAKLCQTHRAGQRFAAYS